MLQKSDIEWPEMNVSPANFRLQASSFSWQRRIDKIKNTQNTVLTDLFNFIINCCVMCTEIRSLLLEFFLLRFFRDFWCPYSGSSTEGYVLRQRWLYLINGGILRIILGHSLGHNVNGLFRVPSFRNWHYQDHETILWGLQSFTGLWHTPVNDPNVNSEPRSCSIFIIIFVIHLYSMQL